MRENRGLFTTDEAQPYLAFEPDMQVERLSERLWTISDGVCRTIFVEGREGVVAFDTFGTPGAEIIADEICAKVVKLREAEGQLQPTRVLTGAENRINVDGVDLALLNPGPTHGSGNLAAWFAEEKLLFSSDTILANARYGLMPDIHLANFVRFMRGFLDLDWDRFVPGRYGLTDRAGFSRGCDYIEAVQDACQQAFVEFVPIWAYEPMRGYVMNKLADSFSDLDGFAEHVGLTAIRIVHHYLMGGWSLEDTPEPGYLLAGEVQLQALP